MSRKRVRDTTGLTPSSDSEDFAAGSPSVGDLRIGCAGWSIPRQSSDHFAAGASHLHRYAQVLNACEINSSFYRPHKTDTWERWRESVPDNFRFSVKVPKTITHENKLKSASELLPPFLRQISVLKDKLGPIFFQLPPSLVFDYDIARQFLTVFRGGYQGLAVWEPRHRSWFSDEADHLLKEFQIARVAADPACVPAAGQPGGYGSLVYFRLHGSPRRYYSSYEDGALELLASQVLRFARKAEAWCVFDNTASGAAIANALSLVGKIGKQGVVAPNSASGNQKPRPNQNRARTVHPEW